MLFTNTSLVVMVNDAYSKKMMSLNLCSDNKPCIVITIKNQRMGG